MYECVACMHVSAPCAWLVSKGSPGTGGTGHGVGMLPCGCWEKDLGPLQKQQDGLITKPPLWPPSRCFNKNVNHCSGRKVPGKAGEPGAEFWLWTRGTGTRKSLEVIQGIKIGMNCLGRKANTCTRLSEFKLGHEWFWMSLYIPHFIYFYMVKILPYRRGNWGN